MWSAQLPVTAFFTSRDGGVSKAPYESLNLGDHVGDDPSAVAHNRGLVSQACAAAVVFMRPEHGSAVAVVDHNHGIGATQVPLADVLVTTVPGLALATLAADCVPLLGFNPATGAVMAAHIGRRGLLAGTVHAAIASLGQLRRDQQSRTPTRELHVSIGPAICGSCYEVSQELDDEVSRTVPQAAAVTAAGKPALDIGKGVVAQLAALGVESIVTSDRCTHHDPETYSYRRDGVTGRHAGVIVCP